MQSDPAQVLITVNPVNDPPVAAGESYTTAEDTPLVVAAPGVLGNDTDIDSSPLTAVPVSGPAHGTLALNGDGSFTYTPGANYNGSDQFTYQASDGTAASAIVTVQLTIQPRNDKPQANAGPDQVREATGPTTTATLNGAGSTDVDGDASITPGARAAPRSGPGSPCRSTFRWGRTPSC